MLVSISKGTSYMGDTPALQQSCLKKKVVIIPGTPSCGEEKAFRKLTEAFCSHCPRGAGNPFICS